MYILFVFVFHVSAIQYLDAWMKLMNRPPYLYLVLNEHDNVFFLLDNRILDPIIHKLIFTKHPEN